MSLDRLLSNLSGVRKTGKDGWIAKCPAHADKSPSLAIKDDAGMVLLHCFAGCSAHEVVAAVELDLSDLFPEKNEDRKSKSMPFSLSDVLRCVAFEAGVVAAAAASINNGNPVTDTDRERVMLSWQRLNAAVEAAGVRA